MKNFLLSLIAVCISTALLHGEEFDDLLKQVISFKPGDESAALQRAEEATVVASNDPKLKTSVEASLIEALESATTRQSKSFVCRMLRIVGTEKSIPALAKLLTDKESSHPARYALGGMEFPAALKAIHEAVSKTDGVVRIGLLDSLAEREYKDAIPDFAKLMGDADAQTVIAAAKGLGKIGGAGAIEALNTAKPSKETRGAINTALLRCAEKDGAASAVKIYQDFFEKSKEEHLRIAGMKGLATIGGKDADAKLMTALDDQNPRVTQTAVGLILDKKGENQTRVLLERLENFPESAQEVILRSLTAAGEKSAAPSARKLADSSKSEQVRAAAIEALGSLGTSQDVFFLVNKASGTNPSEAGAARSSLQQLKATGTDEALLALFDSSLGNAKIETINALARRKTKAAISLLATASKDKDEATRHASIMGLSGVVSNKTLQQFTDIAAIPQDKSDHSVISRGLKNAFRNSGEAEQSKALLSSIKKASDEGKEILIPFLASAPTAEALTAVRKLISSEHKGIKASAISALTNWPTAEVADDLLGLAASKDTKTKRDALKGFVRVAELSDQSATLYEKALKIASDTQEKRMVISGLANSRKADTLPLLLPNLANSELKEEAGVALIKIAKRLRKSAKPEVKAAMLAVIKADVMKRTKDQAKDLLEKL